MFRPSPPPMARLGKQGTMAGAHQEQEASVVQPVSTVWCTRSWGWYPLACMYRFLFLLCSCGAMCSQAGTLAEAHELLGSIPSAQRVPGASRRVPHGFAVRNLWEGGRGRAQQETENASAVFLPLLHSLELQGFKFGVRGAVGTSGALGTFVLQYT